MKKTIAFITDIHFDEQYTTENNADPYKNWELMFSDILSKDPDALVFGGDIGGATSHEYFFKSLKAFPGELDIIAGNHDKANIIKKYFSKDAFPGVEGLYYSYEDERYLYIFLDSSADNIDENQLSWFTNELANNRKNVLLFIHHPVLSINSPIDEKFPLQNREAIKKLLIEHGHDVHLFCGHYHTEDTTQEKKITQYCTPSSCFQIEKNKAEIITDASNFGYRMVNIEDNAISTEVHWFTK